MTTGALIVNGGPGGTPSGSSPPSGGPGSPGWVRWDSPVGGPPSGATLGPSFAGNTPLVLTTASLMLQGAPNHQFDVRVIDATGTHPDQQGASFDAASNATITPH